jgi:riboflavin synthase
MFSGIVEQAGKVVAIKPTANSLRFTVAARGLKRLKIGDSLAVNGTCLTVVKIQRSGSQRGQALVSFDVLKETWRVTNFQFLKPGGLVNLEQSLRASDPIGGHFVLGHVDGVGKITRWEKIGNDWLLEIAPPAEVRPYLIYKGSVAVDGISLTLAKVGKKTFQIWIIPHTFEVTNLQQRRVGDYVNLEADMIGKYVAKLLKK